MVTALIKTLVDLQVTQEILVVLKKTEWPLDFDWFKLETFIAINSVLSQVMTSNGSK